ncbi:MgtC/SapB family protein [Clostridium perfringens]|nr:MgtC/SapB family protein [Clostridium perfringens]
MDISQVGIRILLSILIGGLIGYNREYENRPAGFRTHVLVCLGATIAALIQVQLGYFVIDEIKKNQALSGVLNVDTGRVICQVISGVGFLGAGAIIQTKGAVKGLTTAASMWAVASVGIAIGMGFYKISILSGISILVVLTFLKKFEDKFISKTKLLNIEIKCLNDKAISEINDYFEENQIRINNIESSCDEEYNYILEVPQSLTSNEIISDLISNKNINKVREIKKQGVYYKWKN